MDERQLTTQPQAIEAPTHYAIARTAEEMSTAKSSIHTFLVRKVAGIDVEIAEAEELLARAVKYRWRPASFRGILQRLKTSRLYYGKLLAAAEAGYAVVPNMDVDLFAIRVRRVAPSQPSSQSLSTYSYQNPRMENESEQRLPIGEGRYESPVQLVTTKKSEGKNDKGEKTFVTTITPVGFAQLEFPLSVAHPLVMDAVSVAMAGKIFDRIGIVPRTGRGDPIVLGQIVMKEGWTTKLASFLIAWYVDARTL